MTNRHPYQQRHRSADSIDELATDTRVRVVWHPPEQPHPSSIEGTVIETAPSINLYRIAAPAPTHELQVYRPPSQSVFGVYAIGVDGTMALGRLESLDILERPAHDTTTDGFRSAVLGWRESDD